MSADCSQRRSVPRDPYLHGLCVTDKGVKADPRWEALAEKIAQVSAGSSVISGGEMFVYTRGITNAECDSRVPVRRLDSKHLYDTVDQILFVQARRRSILFRTDEI
jgi:hypothetical protein